MTGRRAADLVRALGGVASSEDAQRILSDAALRRSLETAWSVEPPSVEMLARVLRKSAHGNHGSLALVQELHLGGAPSTTARRTRSVVAALHRWFRTHGDLTWFTEVSPVAHSRTTVPAADEHERDTGPAAPSLSCSWRESDAVLEVRAGADFDGHQVVLLLGCAGSAVDLVGPSALALDGDRVRAFLAAPGHRGPRWAEALTR